MASLLIFLSIILIFLLLLETSLIFIGLYPIKFVLLKLSEEESIL